MSLRGVIGHIVENRKNETEFSFDWRIKDFFSFTGECGNRYVSPDFFFCKAHWCLLLHPNGTLSSSTLGLVSIFLFRQDYGPPMTVSITLAIRGAKGIENERKKVQEFSINDPACIWFTFSSVSELREYQSRLAPGSVLTIACTMKSAVLPVARDVSTQTNMRFRGAKVLSKENQSEVSTQTDMRFRGAKVLSKENQSGVKEWQNSLLKWLESGKESDVIIKVGDKEFRAHRQLLQARSPVFEAMFSHDMVERQSGTVAMEDCDPEIFPDFLKHIYTGSTDVITVRNVFGLYAASDKYDLSALKEECAEFMKENLSVANFCEAITLAVNHDEKELIAAVTEFFSENTISIAKTVQWQTFLAENPTVANELFILSYTKKK